MAATQTIVGGGGRNAWDTVAASTASSELVPASAGKRILVLAIGISCGGTPSTVQFLSDAGACGPIFQNSISMPEVRGGWFETDPGEALNVATGAGSNTGLIVKWSYA